MMLRLLGAVRAFLRHQEAVLRHRGPTRAFGARLLMTLEKRRIDRDDYVVVAALGASIVTDTSKGTRDTTCHPSASFARQATSNS